MHIDGRSITSNSVIQSDVCIVGAGTAGVTLARELVGQNFKVTLLESGDLNPAQETQRLCDGKNVGYPYFPLETARARYFGGSSNRWHIKLGDNNLGARIRPLDEIDFEKREWVPYSGWPFTKSDLDPYYERAEAICQTGEFTYQVDKWEDKEKTPCLPLIEERLRTIIFKFGSRDPFVRDCSEEISKAENISVFLNSNVVDIETGDTGNSVSRLRVATLAGNIYYVSAKLFVLATGGIETPRLLLQSNKKFPAGIGNKNDLVGRFFMEHLHFWSGMFVPVSSDIFKYTRLYAKAHRVNNVPIMAKLALSEQVLRTEKLLNSSIQLLPRVILEHALPLFTSPTKSSEGIRSLKKIMSDFRHARIPENAGRLMCNVFNDIGGIGRASGRLIRHKSYALANRKRLKLFLFAHMTEQAPNPDSRIILSSETDSLGQPKIKLDWKISEFDKQSTIRTQEIVQEELRRAGLGRSYVLMNKNSFSRRGFNGGWHHMGTTRMNSDTRQGVVDADSRVHEISNLYIAGPSVFPTGGQANPVLTIVALTVRLADHIKEKIVSSVNNYQGY